MDLDGTPYRLQVKYRELNLRELREGRHRYELQATTVINGKQTPINRSLIDGWAVYCKNDDRVIIVPVEYCNDKTNLTLNINTNFGGLTSRGTSCIC